MTHQDSIQLYWIVFTRAKACGIKAASAAEAVALARRVCPGFPITDALVMTDTGPQKVEVVL